jgi:endosialidase-like protein
MFFASKEGPLANRSIRTLLTFGTLFLLIPISLIAQLQRDVIPLKPWPAPLYWQPTQAENQIAAQPATFGNEVAEDTRPANSLVFVGMTPCRVVDTRTGSGFTGAFGPPSLVGGAKRTFPIQSSTTCSIPSIAQAYSFNITIVPPGFVDFVTVGPTPVSTPPTFSTLNGYVCAFSSSPCVISNAAIVPAGTSGSVDVYASQNTNLIVDINGYYAAQSGITLAQGNATAPSLSFLGDPGTGIFSSGAGALNITTGGTNRLSVRSDGDVELPGSIRKGGFLFLHNLGVGNTGVGSTALGLNTTGNANTGVGSAALGSNTIGIGNTGVGFAALTSNSTGGENTASGFGALYNNTAGFQNTASGSDALAFNSTGGQNTASGYQALYSNTTGLQNTASGNYALVSNATGSNNTANGYEALISSTGSYNIAFGYQAGYNVTSTGNNIHIGNRGVSTDANTIRIGTGSGDILPEHKQLFLAAVRGVTPAIGNGVNVLIDSNGQLGTLNSSRRFKEDIHDMGESSSGLLRLRPVTFRYKKPYADGSKPLDYGLIAEEVAEVYPDLVVKGEDGQIETVQYQKLTPMLLNEVQKQHEQIVQQQEQNRKLEERLAALEAILSAKVQASAGNQ